MTWISLHRHHPHHSAAPFAATPIEVLKGRRIDAVVFDLDGVLTDTASLHLAAWTPLFDDVFQRAGALQPDGSPRRFTAEDYRLLVDGEPRLDGIHRMLAEVGLSLPEGSPKDRPGVGSVWALANAKDARYESLLVEAGPRPDPSAVALVHHLHEAGLGVAVISASRHCHEVLATAALAYLVDVVVDGWSAAAMGLAGKPDPATYLEAVTRLGVEPADAVVVEGAPAGVRAGRAGGFGVVIGVDHGGLAEALTKAGADLVVTDLSQVRFDLAPTTGWSLDLTDTVEGEHPSPGLDDRQAGSIDKSAELEATVSVPNSLPFNFSAAGGGWLGESSVDATVLRASIDLNRGLLVRVWRVLDEMGRRTLVVERRLVPTADPHLAAQQLSVIAENWSGQLRLRCELDGNVAAAPIAGGAVPASPLPTVEGGGEGPKVSWLAVRTPRSDVLAVGADRIALTAGALEDRKQLTNGSGAGQELTFTIAESGRATIERVVAISTAGDRLVSEPRLAVVAAVERARTFESLLREHHDAWAHLWRCSRVVAECARAGLPGGTSDAGPPATTPAAAVSLRRGRL